MHPMLEPAHNPNHDDSSLVRRIDGTMRSSLHRARYSTVEKRLQGTALYDAIFLNDFAPAERMARWWFMNEFCMPFAVEVYSYSAGGNQVTLYWVWKAPLDAADSDNSKTTATISSINKKLKVFHTRAMRRVCGALQLADWPFSLSAE